MVRWLAGVAMALGSTGIAWGQDRLTIELPATAVGRGEVSLGDFDGQREGESALRRAAEEVEIAKGRCSLPTTRLSRGQIERRLFAAVAALRGRIDWRGSEEVVVRWNCQTIATDQIVDSAKAGLAGQVRATELGRFVLLRRPPALVVPSGQVSLTAEPIRTSMARRRVVVPVVVQVDGRERARVPVWFAARQFDDENGPIAAALDGRCSNCGDSDPAQRLTAVARKQHVSFRLASGSIALESSAIALADAEVGQTVLVRLAGGRKVLKGRVIAPGVVESKE